MKARAHVFISGRVQGVFFRSQTRHEANKYSVNGWVRNLPDDRVEAVFEGEEEDVKRLIEFCKRGTTCESCKSGGHVGTLLRRVWRF